MREFHALWARALWLLCACGCSSAWAQFDAAKVKSEPPSVAQRFPAPQVRYATPGLKEARPDFPSHAEVEAYLAALPPRSPSVALHSAGKSQRGLSIPLVVLTGDGNPHNGKPVVLVLGQQHGNEPAGGEAALALAEVLALERSDLLQRVNVLIMPRANPDGAEAFQRATASGLDVNRDHLLLQTPEARAIAAVALRYRPQVVLDLHEFTVGDRWITKFGAYARYDALLQAATVGNMDASVADLALKRFVKEAERALASQGLSTFWYHTSSADPKDRVVSMGGVQPDTGRNVYGLRNAVSILIETRGVGLGRAHLLRRVHSHVLAALSVIEEAGAQGPALVSAVREADQAMAAQACRGEAVILARATPGRQQMLFVDAVTGEDKVLEVEWRSALTLQVDAQRQRPCGYWLAADQVRAVENLKLLGLRVERLGSAGPASVERYQVTSDKGGERQDARGAIAAERPIRQVQVTTQALTQELPAGSWYVPLDQPLAALAFAALEPDSQSSFVANHALDLTPSTLLRVMQPMSSPLLGGGERQ